MVTHMNKKYRITLSAAERQELNKIMKAGQVNVRALKRAQMLLKADESPGGAAWSDAAIAEALEVHPMTVWGVRKRYRARGLKSVLAGQYTGHNQRVMTGEVEAHLIAVACGEPPEGREAWTLQLLADQLVSLELVDQISDETVRRTLKKTNLSRGSKPSGAFHPKPTPRS
jgi:transposase